MNEKERNASIEYILSKGLGKPQTMYSRIAEMFRAVGFRYIFWDAGYSIFFSAVSCAIAFALFISSPTDYKYSAAVAVAPLSFLLIMTFAETSERACGLYELKQTCRYTIRQITALRLLCYSIVGAVFTAVVSVIGTSGVYGFFSMFTLCLSALFICAALSLTVMRYLRNTWANAVYSAAWVIVNLTFPVLFGGRWEKVLGSIPIAISLAVASACAAVFAVQISKMLSEVKKYAVA